MALQFVNPTEDRNFKDGETIYDVDGNAYTYRASINSALLKSGNQVSYSLATEAERNCFSRTDPRG